MSALCALFDNRSAAGTPSLAALLSTFRIRSTGQAVWRRSYARKCAYLLPKRNHAATIPALTTFTNPKLAEQNDVDLSFTYDFGDKAEIYAGINNVLDKDPPIIVGQGGYGNTFPATYDYAGMTLFLGFNVKSF